MPRPTRPERLGEASLTVVAGARRPRRRDVPARRAPPTRCASTRRSETGAVRGVYDLAAAGARRAAGRPSTSARRSTSRLPFRMVDIGAVGRRRPTRPRGRRATTTRTPRRRSPTSSCRTRPTSTPRRPRRGLRRLRRVRPPLARRTATTRSRSPGFIEYVTFDERRRRPGLRRRRRPPSRRRSRMREAFGPFWDRADELGMKVFLRTDMLDAHDAARGVPDRPVRLARHRRTPRSGTSTRRASTSSTPRAGARRRAHPHRRGGPRLRRRGLGLLLRARRDVGRLGAGDARRRSPRRPRRPIAR